jgi:hypothetical protein
VCVLSSNRIYSDRCIGGSFSFLVIPADRSSDGGTTAMEANFQLLSSETPDTSVEFSMGQYLVTLFL